MKKTTALTLSAAAVLGLAVPAGAATKDTRGVKVADCKDKLGVIQGEFRYDGVTTAWPPNHKYRYATITLTDVDAEPATDEATLVVTPSHDQVRANGFEFVGSGNTSWLTDGTGGTDTGTPTASVPVSFRGERSGTDQTGRTYSFLAEGTTDNGLATCEPVTFTAEVPHDQGKN